MLVRKNCIVNIFEYPLLYRTAQNTLSIIQNSRFKNYKIPGVLCVIYGQNQLNFTRIKNFKPYIIPGSYDVGVFSKGGILSSAVRYLPCHMIIVKTLHTSNQQKRDLPVNHMINFNFNDVLRKISARIFPISTAHPIPVSFA